MNEPIHEAFSVILSGALRRLHPARADRHPRLFILEVAAALLSVLALRDKIAGGPAVSVEFTAAVGLWATLLVATCRLSVRLARASMMSGGRETESLVR